MTASLPPETPRAGLPTDGPIADRVRELLRDGFGRPRILATLQTEGHAITDTQVRTLVARLRKERAEIVETAREAAIEKATADLLPGIPGDLQALLEVRDTMLVAAGASAGASL